MTRRTYYYSRSVADDLAAAVDEIHYVSHGRTPKHAALDAIIAAGVALAEGTDPTQAADQLKQRLSNG